MKYITNNKHSIYSQISYAIDCGLVFVLQLLKTGSYNVALVGLGFSHGGQSGLKFSRFTEICLSPPPVLALKVYGHFQAKLPDFTELQSYSFVWLGVLLAFVSLVGF